MIIDYCKTTKDVSDSFVGIRFIEGKPEVVFPYGFDCSFASENELRKGVFNLIAVLKKFAEKTIGEEYSDFEDNVSDFPLEAYQYIIYDFLANGYYVERETQYIQGTKGKINWKRTIQREQPQIDNDNVVYLTFQTKVNRINDNNLITLIHKWCVWEALSKFGWLFIDSDLNLNEPQIKLEGNEELFLSVLKDELAHTFNDNKKKLFNSMIDIIEKNEHNTYDNNSKIGVNEFWPIWEKLIGYVFGEDDIQDYYPHGNWHIIKDDRIANYSSSSLRPDTIMKTEEAYYILDAKYYKYGIEENNVNQLPSTESIQKQITYAKYLDENNRNDLPIYNAFVMPYNGGLDPYKFIGFATADWEKYKTDEASSYAYIEGILLDTRYILSNYVRRNRKEIERLSKLINESFDKNKQLIIDFYNE